MDTRTTNVLSICSGLGGIELGLRSVIPTRTVCYLENESSACAILASRIRDGCLDDAPIWTDMRTFDPEPWRGKVDILAGGFPCQPHSVAGNKLGEDDPRELSGEVVRIAAGLGYPTLFLENVPGILRFYWDSIRPKLREMGYSVAEGLFTASETGAPHRRERLFILAHAGESRIWDQARTPRGGTRVEDVRQGDGQERTVRSFSTGMDDSEHNGCTGTEEPRGVGLRTRFSTTREIEPQQPARSSSGTGRDHELADRNSKLADTGRESERQPCSGLDSRRQEPSAEKRIRPTERDGPRNGNKELADSRCRYTAQGQDSESCTDSNGEELADCDPGLSDHEEEEVRPRGEPSESRSSEGELADTELSLYPPGPGDREGWAYMLTVMPKAQPTFCRVADGASTGVDRRLRAVGNGVVPAVAAKAFRTLTRDVTRPPNSPVPPSQEPSKETSNA